MSGIRDSIPLLWDCTLGVGTFAHSFSLKLFCIDVPETHANEMARGFGEERNPIYSVLCREWLRQSICCEVAQTSIGIAHRAPISNRGQGVRFCGLGNNLGPRPGPFLG